METIIEAQSYETPVIRFRLTDTYIAECLPTIPEDLYWYADREEIARALTAAITEEHVYTKVLMKSCPAGESLSSPPDDPSLDTFSYLITHASTFIQIGCMKFSGIHAEALRAWALSKASIVIKYTNYRGQTADRRIAPLTMRFGSTEYYPEPQWLLDAFDLDRNANRSFALKHILSWSETKPEALAASSLEEVAQSIIELAIEWGASSFDSSGHHRSLNSWRLGQVRQLLHNLSLSAPLEPRCPKCGSDIGWESKGALLRIWCSKDKNHDVYVRSLAELAQFFTALTHTLTREQVVNAENEFYSLNVLTSDWDFRSVKGVRKYALDFALSLSLSTKPSGKESQ